MVREQSIRVRELRVRQGELQAELDLVKAELAVALVVGGISKIHCQRVFEYVGYE